MLFLSPGVYKNVVNENHDKLIMFCIHTMFIKYMKNTDAFVKPKDSELIKPIAGREGCFWNILQSDLDLMIAQS